MRGKRPHVRVRHYLTHRTKEIKSAIEERSILKKEEYIEGNRSLGEESYVGDPHMFV